MAAASVQGASRPHALHPHPGATHLGQPCRVTWRAEGTHAALVWRGRDGAPPLPSCRVRSSGPTPHPPTAGRPCGRRRPHPPPVPSSFSPLSAPPSVPPSRRAPVATGWLWVPPSLVVRSWRRSAARIVDVAAVVVGPYPIPNTHPVRRRAAHGPSPSLRPLPLVGWASPAGARIPPHPLLPHFLCRPFFSSPLVPPRPTGLCVVRWCSEVPFPRARGVPLLPQPLPSPPPSPASPGGWPWRGRRRRLPRRRVRRCRRRGGGGLRGGAPPVGVVTRAPPPLPHCRYSIPVRWRREGGGWGRGEWTICFGCRGAPSARTRLPSGSSGPGVLG